jgi:hypothetical protein
MNCGFSKKQPGVIEPLENPYNFMKSCKESSSYLNFQLLINILNVVHVQGGWIIIPQWAPSLNL